MGIESVFPDNGTVPSLNLQIGGAPLADILADMVRLIRCQQRELEILRREVSDRFQRNECDLQKHDEVTNKLSEDLKLHARPISCYGQPPMMTMADVVTNIDYRLARVENMAKNDSAVRLGEVNSKKLIAAYFNRWLLHRKLRGLAQSMGNDVHRDIWQRYLRKWVRYFTLQTRRRAQQRHLIGLLTVYERRVLLAYWRRWHHVVGSRREGRVYRRISAHGNADVMLRMVSREVARRAFNCWLRFLEASRNAKTRAMGTLLLEQKTARLVAERYLQKWVDAHRWRRFLLMRFRALEVMRGRINQEMARCYLRRWVSSTSRRRRHRRVHSFVLHLHHANLAALARRYFSRLYTFRLLRHDARVKEALEQRLQRMNERADVLQKQLDMGLRTLAHTNSVLARVVDTVAITEEPRSAIQYLLQEEMMTPVTGLPSASDVCKTDDPSIASLTSPQYGGESGSSAEREGKPTSVKHSETSARDILNRLRTRLDKTYHTDVGLTHFSV